MEVSFAIGTSLYQDHPMMKFLGKCLLLTQMSAFNTISYFRLDIKKIIYAVRYMEFRGYYWFAEEKGKCENSPLKNSPTNSKHVHVCPLLAPFLLQLRSSGVIQKLSGQDERGRWSKNANYCPRYGGLMSTLR